MKIVDLVKIYAQGIKSGEINFYFHSYPQLFKHYYKYWGNKPNFLKSKEIIKPEVVLLKRNIIIKQLSFINENFLKAGFNLKKLTIILFVGQRISNGHAFKDKKEFKVWLPVENYNTPKQAKVFITHEIAHALHYKQTPAFYFLTKKERNQTARQLITEGVATYMTKQILNINNGESLWADFLPSPKIKQWLQTCREQLPLLTDTIIKNFYKDSHKLFLANNPQKITEFRAGYYVALLAIKSLADQKKYEIKTLLSIPRKKLETEILTILKNLTNIKRDLV